MAMTHLRSQAKLLTFILICGATFGIHNVRNIQTVIQPVDPAADCPPVEDYTAEYHLDTVCNKRAQNTFQDSLGRGRIREWLQQEGIYHVPNRRTHHCPPAPLIDMFQHFNSSDPTYLYGYPTMWIVHNTAKTPVVVSWVDRSKRIQTNDGINYYQEVSAIDGKTSPAHHDPNAILQPGQWRMIDTFDGHVFYVRRLDGSSMGPVVMQHRVGLIPVQNVFGHALEQFCDPNDPDIEPTVEVGDDHHKERAPEFKRSLRPPLRACNTQDIGFRNLVGCPLNVYYSGTYNMTGSPRQADEACSLTQKSCHEEFKFHLGKNPYSDDFHWGWDSQTKFEGTFVGHNFVFRLQANDHIVVDTVTVEPTYVLDCPNIPDSIYHDPYRKSLLDEGTTSVSDVDKMATRRLANDSTRLRTKKNAEMQVLTPKSDYEYDDEEF